MSESSGLRCLKNRMRSTTSDLCDIDLYRDAVQASAVDISSALSVDAFISKISRVSIRKIAYDYLGDERLHIVKLALMMLYDRYETPLQNSALKSIGKLVFFNETALPSVVRKYAHAIRVYGEYNFEEDIYGFADRADKNDIMIFTNFHRDYSVIGDAFEDYIIATDIEENHEAKLAYFFMNTYAYLKDTKRISM